MADRILYSLGHSNHDLERFLELLAEHGIEVVADVRSQPWSGRFPHFRRDELRASLEEAGLGYHHLGKELGGRPGEADLYDHDGRVRYDRLSTGEEFRTGLGRLLELAACARVAVLCAEEDPRRCHRHHLLGRVLDDEGVSYLHLRRDGSIEAEERVASETRAPVQGDLFAEAAPWRSLDPIRVADRPAESRPPPSGRPGELLGEGPLRKMTTRYTPGEPVAYSLPVGDGSVDLANLLGRPLRISTPGEIRCLHCGRKTKRSYSQGFCFPCARSLASCDLCLVKPELCHYAAGTCREPEWGEAHCLIPHVVYLARSSAIKVGITRAHRTMGRWIDQGASQALPLLEVGERLHAGLVEVALAKHVSDRTNWREMLRGPGSDVDLIERRAALLEHVPAEIDTRPPGEDGVVSITYPVLEYPTKVRSLDLEKTPEIEGTLLGIKGQYLILDVGVLNVRKFGGYVARVERLDPS